MMKAIAVYPWMKLMSSQKNNIYFYAFILIIIFMVQQQKLMPDKNQLQ